MTIVNFFQQNLHIFTLPVYFYILSCVVLSLLWFFGTDTFDRIDDAISGDDDTYSLIAVFFCIAVADVILNSVWKLNQPFNVMIVFIYTIIELVIICIALYSFILDANYYFRRKRGKG